jgi:23S rRNA maturation mini-RNase III
VIDAILQFSIVQQIVDIERQELTAHQQRAMADYMRAKCDAMMAEAFDEFMDPPTECGLKRARDTSNVVSTQSVKPRLPARS